jgi:hypothetical protein
MSRLLRLTFILLGLLLLTSTSSLAVHTPTIKSSETKGLKLAMQSLTVDDIINLKRKEIELKLGTKLKFKERIALVLVKKKVKRAKRKGINGEELVSALASDETKHHGFVGFLLGFFLVVWGVIIAYLAFEKGDKGRKWAWIGFLSIMVLFFGLLFAVGVPVY